MGREPREPGSARDLVERIEQGDRQAEEEAVERYSAGLRHLLLRLTRDPSQADDLHQETFRLAIEKLRSGGALEDPDKLASFLRGTARNLFLGGIRKAKRQRETLDRDGPVDVSTAKESPLAEVLRDEEALLVRELLGQMRSERDRQILFRFYIGEEGRQRIREDLGLEPLQFNRVLHRSRQRFKELWEKARGARKGAP